MSWQSNSVSRPFAACVRSLTVPVDTGSQSQRAVALGMLNSFGQCFSILASFIFPSNEGPKYAKALTLNIAFGAVGLVLSIGMMVYYSKKHFLPSVASTHGVSQSMKTPVVTGWRAVDPLSARFLTSSRSTILQRVSGTCPEVVSGAVCLYLYFSRNALPSMLASESRKSCVRAYMAIILRHKVVGMMRMVYTMSPRGCRDR
jgi:hypothetical protein